MKIKHAFAALLLLLTFTACKKKDDHLPPGKKPYDLLRKITYPNNLIVELEYNTDGTLKQINYPGIGAGNGIFLRYANKQLIETGYDNSLNANTYTYENGLVTKVMNKRKQGASPTSYYLEYAYNNDGTPATQKYYVTNEAGTVLTTTSAYQYNSDRSLKQVTSTYNNGDVVIYRIQAYSAVHNVAPVVFISHDLTEFHSIYNFPVMRDMHRLPAKVTQSVKQPNGDEKITRIDEQQYQISHRKLVKMFNKITYPEFPQGNSLDTVMYTY